MSPQEMCIHLLHPSCVFISFTIHACSIHQSTHTAVCSFAQVSMHTAYINPCTHAQPARRMGPTAAKSRAMAPKGKAKSPKGKAKAKPDISDEMTDHEGDGQEASQSGAMGSPVTPEEASGSGAPPASSRQGVTGLSGDEIRSQRRNMLSALTSATASQDPISLSLSPLSLSISLSLYLSLYVSLSLYIYPLYVSLSLSFLRTRRSSSRTTSHFRG